MHEQSANHISHYKTGLDCHLQASTLRFIIIQSCTTKNSIMVLAAMLVHGSSTQMQKGAGIGTRMHRILNTNSSYTISITNQNLLYRT